MSSNNNDDHDSPDRIASDLAQVEQQLSQPRSYSSSQQRGRAAFESVASALTSLRHRLTRSTTPSSSSTQGQPSTPAAAAAAPSNNNAVSTSETSLMERLTSAEMAHSHRIPLQFLEQERERRRSHMTLSSTQAKPDDDDEMMTENEQQGMESSSTSDRPPSPSKAEMTSSTASSVSASSSGSGTRLSAGRRRHASSLMASRSRDEALQQPALDRELHSAGIEAVLLSPVAETDETDDGASGSMEMTVDEGIPTTILDGDDKPQPMDVDTPVAAKTDDNDDDNLSLLLTQQSRSRLPFASSSILLASTHVLPDIGIDESTETAQDSIIQPTADTVVYSWGMDGRHSLHSDSECRAPGSAKITEGRLTRNTVKDVSVGPHHSAVVTMQGQVLTCGDNRDGQVDPTASVGSYLPKPTLFEFLSMTRITQVSCGFSHTAAITAGGTVLTWGSNEVGQLGHRQKSKSIPTAMVGVSRAAQVACGNEFTTVLTSKMKLYCCGTQDVIAWDSNAAGKAEPTLPRTIPTLEGLPLVKVSAGARHVIVLTAIGSAYTWGCNDSGVCARKYPNSIHTPVPLIFTMDNQNNETYHVMQDRNNSPFPHWGYWEGAREPLSLDPNIAIQDVACGESHTILLAKSGSLYVCGSNGQGQLGLEECIYVAYTATRLKLPESTGTIVAVAAGRTHSLLLNNNGDVWGMGNGEHEVKEILQGQGISRIVAGGGESVAIAPSSTKAAMQRETSLGKGGSDDEMDVQDGGFMVEKLIELKDKSRLLNRIREFFGCPHIWNSLFFDVTECEDLYKQLLVQSGDDEMKIAIPKAIESSMLQGLDNLRSSARLLWPESVRFLLLFLQCPLFVDPKVGDEFEFDLRGDLALSLCETFLNLPFEGYKAVMKWATTLYGQEHFSRLLVRPLISILEQGLRAEAGAKSRCVPGVITLLRWFHGAFQQNTELAKPEDFFSEAIAFMEPEALYEDLKKWKETGKKSSAMCLSANPFLLSPTTKRTLLNIENQVEMLRAATSNLTWDHQQHQFVFDPYFVLAIDRQYLLTQTLQKISQASHVELRKSLKIVFKGEDAVDAGGVLKEFMYLLSHQLFDPSTGMWVGHHQDNNILWPNGDCHWNEEGYYLTGVMVGLAVYNDVILDVHFPRAIYRKLLGHTLGLEDLFDEETRRGLQQLLDYEGDDVEDIFCLSFEHTWMDLGIQRRVELKPGGADIAVTSENKEEYVMLYVKWLLVDSIQEQYEAFERGVMHVLESSSLDLLSPEEFELLLVGSPDLDIDAWESNTKYEGFEADDPVIRNFWKFVRNSNRETHLQLLKFATGTSRAPIGGLGKMPFCIQRAGPDSMQLPTSHTCFNILIIPDYGDDYQKLEHLVGRAILECEGFGLQ